MHDDDHHGINNPTTQKKARSNNDIYAKNIDFYAKTSLTYQTSNVIDVHVEQQHLTLKGH
jgi:hypothetical protein